MANEIGPKNKVLRKDFLLKVIECFGATDSRVRGGTCESTDSRVLQYHRFLKSDPQINHGGEVFKIKDIWISNSNTAQTEKTYRDAWYCDDPPDEDTLRVLNNERCLSCEKDYRDWIDLLNADGAGFIPDEDTRGLKGDHKDAIIKDKITYYSIGFFVKHFKDKLTYEGSYRSSGHTDFLMTLNYCEILNVKGEAVSITLTLGPAPTLKKYIKRDSEWWKKGKPPVEYVERISTNYWPGGDGHNFDDEFRADLQKSLLDLSKTVEYRGITYEIIDCKFCRVLTEQSDCCWSFYCMCAKRTVQDGALHMPLKTTSWETSSNVSCTPEWYIQFRIGSCISEGGYCGRVILNAIAHTEKGK